MEERKTIEAMSHLVSDAIPRMPRPLTARERFSDHVFFLLQLLSWFLFVICGLFGFVIAGPIASGFSLCFGWLTGVWMRRSLGRRDSDPFLSFYKRIDERASGARRGLLECLVEAIRGSGFSLAQCQAISSAYNRAMKEVRSTNSTEEQETILKRLDGEVKRISYLGVSNN